MNFICHFIAHSLGTVTFFHDSLIRDFFPLTLVIQFLWILQIAWALSQIFMSCCCWPHTTMKIVCLFLTLYFLWFFKFYLLSRWEPSLLSHGNLVSLIAFYNGLCQQLFWISGLYHLDLTRTYNCWILFKTPINFWSIASFYKKHIDSSLISLMYLCAYHSVL